MDTINTASDKIEVNNVENITTLIYFCIMYMIITNIDKSESLLFNNNMINLEETFDNDKSSFIKVINDNLSLDKLIEFNTQDVAIKSIMNKYKYEENNKDNNFDKLIELIINKCITHISNCFDKHKNIYHIIYIHFCCAYIKEYIAKKLYRNEYDISSFENILEYMKEFKTHEELPNIINKYKYNNFTIELDKTNTYIQELYHLLRKIVYILEINDMNNYDYTNNINHLIDDNRYTINNIYLYSITDAIKYYFDNHYNINNNDYKSAKKIAFTSYYSLSIRLKRNKESLTELENDYSNFFKNEEILLNYEMLSRFAKRKKTKTDYEKALENDSKYIQRAENCLKNNEMPDEFNGKIKVVHLGVYLSYISTVTDVLESDKFRNNVSETEIINAEKYADIVYTAFNNNRKYYSGRAKICFLMGRLKLFKGDYNKDNIKSAIKNLEEAKTFQEKESQDYYIRIMECDEYIKKANEILITHDSNEKIEILNERYNSIDDKINKKYETIDTRINESQVKMIELMALFTAIVQIMLGTINIAVKIEDPMIIFYNSIILSVASLTIYLIIVIVNTYSTKDINLLIKLIITAFMIIVLIGISILYINHNKEMQNKPVIETRIVDTSNDEL